VKSWIENAPEQEPKIEYPCLMRAIADQVGMVVLMSKPGEGVVVKIADIKPRSKFGQWKNNWDTHTFEPLSPGERVVLEA